MGGGSSTVTDYGPVQKEQAQILKALQPLLTQYGQETLPLQTSLNTQQLSAQSNAMPALTGMLNAAVTGSPTSQQEQNLGNTQQQVRKQAADMGVAPTDPRMGQGFQQAAQSQTMGSMPELQTIMSLFGTGQSGMAPNTLMSQLGSGQAAGSTTNENPGAGAAIGTGVSAAASLAMMIAALWPK